MKNNLFASEFVQFILDEQDSHNCYDSTSKNYTFPITGRYLVKCYGELDIIEVNAGESIHKAEYVEKLMNKP